jgi:hypothetical protein
MKRALLIITFILATFSLSAQVVGYDVLSISVGDVTGNDTALVANINKIGNCMGNMVVIIMTVKNTDEVTDTFNLGGGVSDVGHYFGVTDYENIAHSELPFIVDTSTVAPAAGGLTYIVNGSNYVYQKTFYMENFPFKYPGFDITKVDLSQGDFRVFFFNIETQ